MNKKSTTSNLKILILVLSSKTYPSSRNKKAIKKTWGSNLKDNFEIMFYESGETTPKIKRNRDWAYANITLARFNLEWLTQ